MCVVDSRMFFYKYYASHMSTTCYCTAFNLILCYHAIGDQEKLKRGFQRLLKVQQNGEDDEDRYYPTVVS